jgi:hypothetical protein
MSQTGKKLIKGEVRKVEVDIKTDDHATAVRSESAGAISLRSRRRAQPVLSTEMSSEVWRRDENTSHKRWINLG